MWAHTIYFLSPYGVMTRAVAIHTCAAIVHEQVVVRLVLVNRPRYGQSLHNQSNHRHGRVMAGMTTDNKGKYIQSTVLC